MKDARNPKLTFVVPLASESAVGDWQKTSRMLEYSLQSLLAVPFDDADVLVVGHELPPALAARRIDRVKFVRVDFDPPALTHVADADIQAKAQDKGRKVELGTKLACANGSEWVMYCDADDFVSSNLSHECSFSSSDAIVFGMGWQWSFGSRRMTRRSNFYRICGTSSLLRLTKRNFPVWLGGASNRVAEQGHNVRVRALKEAGAVVQMVRRPLAVYAVDNGSNYYYNPLEGRNDPLPRRVFRAVKRYANTYRITEKLRLEFSMPD